MVGEGDLLLTMGAGDVTTVGPEFYRVSDCQERRLSLMGLFNAVMALSGMIDTDVIEDERLARHTSYRIGGKADLFVTCHSYHALRRAVRCVDREQVPWVIIG